MPGLSNSLSPVTSPPPPAQPQSSVIWSKKRDDINFDQLQKFWSELPLQKRRELLRIDKQTLLEQARKNLYCSRCNGLLPEDFVAIITYSKSLKQEVSELHISNRTVALSDSESEDVKDPSVHPWGGLVATRDGMLTLQDCFIRARSLKALENVFDNARARERDREMSYPDACGGGGRGWISQGMTNYGRGHGTRETCALHTARLSCETLVGFWNNLGKEPRTVLLRMKEEDFIERLMYRFDSKRFCRDCRRNVIREFKELKELKRMRRELRCTSWFCVADTTFQYEVSEDTVQADWRQSFAETVGTYHHFEWAIGTGEGKSDILEFEDVGMNGKVHVDGLDLGGLTACFITLRAWKLDGRCTEFCVKAHALKGQPCVHRRLMMGDGFVKITEGESIESFFEHAEEAEEEEDDDSVDRDGNEFDADVSRPQKHAKSPELAREFLLDAATVIFKEQVEKAFREGVARKNSHNVFVALAMKSLEDRVHVACKEITTLEKQIKLLEEEEKEKREEEERRERRRAKEREKKLRRKERLKGKGRKQNESSSLHDDSLTSSTHDELSPMVTESGDSVSDPGDVFIKYEDSFNGCTDTKDLKNDEEFHIKEGKGLFVLEQSKSSKRRLRLNKESLLCQSFKWHEESDTKLTSPARLINGGHRQLRERVIKTNPRNFSTRSSEKFQCSSIRLRDRHEFISCSCSQNGDYRTRDSYRVSTVKPLREIRAANKTIPTFYRGNFVLTKGKASPVKEIPHTRQVWEPLDSRRKGTRIISDSDANPRAAHASDQSEEIESDKSDSCRVPKNLKDGKETSCDGFVAMTKSDCSDPVMNSSSSDNCSSCLSEGDSSMCSSRANNAESSSSTSDSEDASPQSEGSDNTSGETCRTSEEFEPEPRKSSQNSESRCFGLGTSPLNPHVLPVHNDRHLHVPVLSAAASVYHSQSAVPWFPQPNHFVFPPIPPSYEFGVHYNPLITAPLLTAHAHSIYGGNNGFNSFSTAATVSSLGSPLGSKQFPSKLTSTGQNPSANESSSFSLFHFGGPVNSVPFDSNSMAVPAANVTCSKENATIEEYSLFSAGNGARFSFF